MDLSSVVHEMREGGPIASDIPTIITHFANVSIKIKGARGWGLKGVAWVGI